MYKKKTLRHMAPTVRKVARIINDLDSATRRLKNLTDDLARLEFDSRALHSHTTWEKAREVHAVHDPISNHTTIDEATRILFDEKEENDELDL
jgi:hypothetical protein